MRLMATIIVALLAITMAVFPISVLPAAAPAGHQHAAGTVGHGHGHEHAGMDGSHRHADVASSGHTALADFGGHDGNSDDCTGPVCCSMGTCHAIQVSALPGLYSPTASQAAMAVTGDEQVGGIVTGGLDRPPRTV